MTETTADLPVEVQLLELLCPVWVPAPLAEGVAAVHLSCGAGASCVRGYVQVAPAQGYEAAAACLVLVAERSAALACR